MPLGVQSDLLSGLSWIYRTVPKVIGPPVRGCGNFDANSLRSRSIVVILGVEFSSTHINDKAVLILQTIDVRPPICTPTICCAIGLTLSISLVMNQNVSVC